jgi:hypothetical protein
MLNIYLEKRIIKLQKTPRKENRRIVITYTRDPSYWKKNPHLLPVMYTKIRKGQKDYPLPRYLLSKNIMSIKIEYEKGS